MGDEVLDLAARPRRNWSGVLGWPLVVLLGWVLFELTAQPAVGVVAVCVKCGWNDFRSARWLRRRDPRPRRGRACWWLHVASGLCKMGAVGAVLFFGLGIAQAVQEGQNRPAQGRPPGTPQEILNAGLVALAGFVLSTAAGARALWLAWRGRCRLWLNPAVHRDRYADRWPPAVGGRWNCAEALLCWDFGIAAAAAAVLLLDRLVVRPDAFAFWFVLAVVLVPALVYGFRARLFGWALARSPEECWGCDDVRVDQERPAVA